MKRSLIACIVSGILLVLALVFYAAWYQTVATASAAADNLGNEITVRSRTQVLITAARAALAQLSSTETDVEAYFVAPQNVVPFIETLQSLGSSIGSTVNVLSVAASPVPGGTSAALPTITISLSITGTFDQVVRTIGAIEYAPYDLTISMLSLSAGAKGIWTADVTLLVGSTASSAAATLPGTEATTTPTTAATTTAATTTTP
jgi:hypothetical protein